MLSLNYLEICGFLASILMGLSLGMVGGGGAILTVPILVYFFSINPLLATSLSLFLVGGTAIVGALLACRQKNVEIKTGFFFAIPSFLGVYLTKSVLIPKIPDILVSFSGFVITKALFLMIIFAILMLLASSAMIFRKKNTQNEGPINTVNSGSSLFHWLKISFQGLFVGGVTGLVGAGGGFLIVPALVNLLRIEMRKAIGTSLSIIAANSLFGFSLALANNLSVDWLQLVTILLFSLIGLFIGARVGQNLSEAKLKLGFGYFILIMGAWILFDQIRNI